MVCDGVKKRADRENAIWAVEAGGLVAIGEECDQENQRQCAEKEGVGDGKRRALDRGTPEQLGEL